MLDDVTKKRINTLRQILVGKLPDPKAQVEQITNALIYKFMNDMDEESLSMGGKATYFSGSFQKYSWKNLMNAQTSGVEKLSLYADALNKMSDNENLPTLFRDIFKDSVLPFKDPATLNMFLKEINEFHYSNSEKLGDAFEYLLSFMGSQGDAGQFRTPRHIIDFITKIVNPQKNEKVLDPACGTAGFLISSYKHILKQNTKKNLGDGLTAPDRKKIGENLNGYDISPDMVKMSLVNMYLHKFTNPKINEYDTLSSEDRWNEYYDVMLANPPFFSPKGGITPHNRFGVKSSKAEVLFVDYINEHLKPDGRAGIIVPEGIIFRDDLAFKTLRLNLIQSSLIGIVSLPAGIFEPYSGVKTSILILDKKKNKKLDYIYFAKVNNDGFTLTKNRTPIEKNDLPDVLRGIIDKDFSNEIIFSKILKKNIIDGNVKVNFEKSKETKTKINLKKLSEVAFVSAGNPTPENKDYFKNGDNLFIKTFDVGQIKFGTINDSREYLNDEGVKKLNLFKKGTILFPKSGASTLLNHRVMLGKNAYVSSTLSTIKGYDEKILDEYLLYILKLVDTKKLVKNTFYPGLNLSNIKDIKIPVPSIEKQKQILNELNGYQKIIDGCNQIINNFKPTIDIDNSWENIELDSLCEKITDGSHFSPKNISKGFPYVTVKDLSAGKIDFLNCKKISEKDYLLLEKNGCKPNKNDILFSKDGTVGKTAFIEDDYKFVVLSSLAILTPKKEKIKPKFLFYMLSSDSFIKEATNQKTGVAIRRIVLKTLKKIKLSIPPLNIQDEIIDLLDNQMSIIRKNKELSNIFKKKLNNKIKSLWSD